jgi:hypothetical protein
MTPNFRHDPAAPQPRDTIRTASPHMPEPRSSTMNHSSDHPPGDKTPEAPQDVPHDVSRPNAPPSDATDTKALTIQSCRSFDSIAPVYGCLGIVHSQQIIPWIDPFDSSGGPWVRAVCSNTPLHVWTLARLYGARNTGRTSRIAKWHRLQALENPRLVKPEGVSATRSARRLLRRGRDSS